MTTGFVVNEKFLAISVDSGTLSLDLNNGFTLNDRLLNKLDVNSKNENDVQDGSVSVSCLAASNSCKYLVVCSHKDIHLWDSKNWTSVHKKLRRAASSVKFSPITGNIVVADKSGDVYLYSTGSFEEDGGKLILGHVSMLLDVLITPDEKFIITCDRDEKIRISRYPEGHYIQYYCLGHREFVLTLSLLGHDPNVLVSGGGDGCLRFWDFVNGKQLIECQCMESDYPIEDSESNNQRTITKIVSLKYKTNESFLFCALNRFNGIVSYKVITDRMKLICSFYLNIKTNTEPLSICLNKFNNSLWMLTSDLNLEVYSVEDNEINKSSDEKISKIKNILFKYKDVLSKAVSSEKLVDSLYKKSFDNVQIYLKRKEERIEGNVKKIKPEQNDS